MMSCRGVLGFWLVFLSYMVCCTVAWNGLSRNDFPEGFIFGTASSAYQYEGAYNEGGRGASIWDTFSHKKGDVLGNANGNVADDQYHHYKMVEGRLIKMVWNIITISSMDFFRKVCNHL
eukprot:c20697_g2_i2 orf=265-621(+)